MLVLTRGCNDKVVFPTLGISVEVLRVTGNKVRLGIEAPKEIPVHRHELSHRIARDEELEAPPEPKLPAPTKLPKHQDHATRNRLNTAALGLHYLHRKIELGEYDDAEATIFKIFHELKSLDDELEVSRNSVEASSQNQSASASSPHPRALLVEDNKRWFSKPVNPQHLVKALQEDLKCENIST